MLRILQVGLGPLGTKIAADAIARGLGTIVAAVDPAHAGEKVAQTQTTVVATLDEVTTPVDVAIVATVSALPDATPTLIALAKRGISAVSTCEELSWPWDRHPDLAQQLDQEARQHGARILGTGVNPGFVMDALAVAVTTACAAVQRVEIHRIQDASTRRIPFQQKIGATLSIAEFEARVAAGKVRHVGLAESIGMVASTLGLAVVRIDETIGPVIAQDDLTCALGAIARGSARGVRQTAHGFDAAGREVITLVFVAAIGEPDPRDAIRVEGNPPVDLVIRGGLHGDIATSAVVLNSVRSLLAAPAGLHTMTTIPMRGCARV